MRHFSVLLGLALITAPALASANEEVSFRLDYQPARGCMDRDTLVLFLEGDFGYRVVRDDARPLVRIALKGSGRKMEAHVSASDDAGVERWQAVIPGPIDCRELMQDTAYAISLNLGKWELKKQEAPSWLLRVPEFEVGTAAPSPPLRPFVAYDDDGPLRRRTLDPFYRVETTSEPPPPTPTEQGLAGPTWAVGASALFVPAGLPGIGAGGGLSLDARWRLWSVGVEFRGMGTWEQEVGVVPVQAATWAGLGIGCVTPHERFGLCGMGGGGSLNVTYTTEISPVDWSDTLVWAGARATFFMYRGERMSVALFGEVLAPLQETKVLMRSTSGELILWRTGALWTLGISPRFEFK
ncbi:hypothetical protein [Polyangium mundeleinium]|uniref:Uncharacterized protein n=1 Tax=Polyangium mundeleinium TaxID=2995306 RepID=A0ABT5F3N7_9BACT|nr:hypothetical protein [Polyangium mundeleinium]MDC0748710.1 hypothetical protein [Polyangium mundeleinium]